MDKKGTAAFFIPIPQPLRECVSDTINPPTKTKQPNQGLAIAASVKNRVYVGGASL
uniref:Uncharacterized protein n=1 Tax=Anguilla anguilla TaxID=7936 RepID=A0A0E9VFR7_ANGAN